MGSPYERLIDAMGGKLTTPDAFACLVDSPDPLVGEFSGQRIATAEWHTAGVSAPNDLISKLTTLKCMTSKIHDYVLFHSGPPDSTPPSLHIPNDVWIKCERFPNRRKGEAGLASLVSSCSFPADDRITLLKKKPREFSFRVKAVAVSNFYVRDLAEFVKRIYKSSPSYRLGTTNCWWFAGVLFTVLPIDQHSTIFRKAQNKLLCLVRSLQDTVTEDETNRLVETIKNLLNPPGSRGSFTIGRFSFLESHPNPL